MPILYGLGICGLSNFLQGYEAVPKLKFWNSLNWIFSNYIQLCLHTEGVPLDYYTVRAREYDFALINPFLPLSSISHYDLERFAGSDGVCEWIKSLIDSGHCVEITLNERFLPNRRAYGAYDFDHINLIYGYNDNNEYMLLGYAEKPVASTASFAEFGLAVNAIKYNSIQRAHLYKFSHNKVEFAFDLPAAVQSLEEYISGTNSAAKMARFMCEADKNILWGINNPRRKRRGIEDFSLKSLRMRGNKSPAPPVLTAPRGGVLNPQWK